MALPIGKQPEAQPEHSGNNADLRTNFIDSINSCRPVYDRGTRYPYLRGRGRNAHIRAWILWENQEPPAAFKTTDHVLRGAPLPPITEEEPLELFPQYDWHFYWGSNTYALINAEDDVHYLTPWNIVKTRSGRVDKIMPHDAIQVQLHQHAAKIVWAHGAANRFDLAFRSRELSRSFTSDDWVSFAHDPSALEDLIKSLLPEWRDEHALALVEVIRSFGSTIAFDVRRIAHGAELYDQNLTEAIRRLYTFTTESRPEEKTWDSYQDFLNSPEWQAKREAVQKRSGGWCESCRVAGVLKRAAHVHHVHYEKPWGQEDTTDLLHLCEEHHRLAHGNVS